MEQLDVITAVEFVNGRVTLVINEDEKIIISKTIWREHRFKEGQNISLENLRSTLLPMQCKEALHYSVSLLAIKAYSVGEIKQKLTKNGYNEDVSEYVIYKLKNYNLVDDLAFTKSYIKSRIRKQQGERKIRFELQQKGISSIIIDEAFENIEEESIIEPLTNLVEKLIKRYKKDEPNKAKQKIISALIRRGYTYEEAKNALSKGHL